MLRRNLGALGLGAVLLMVAATRGTFASTAAAPIQIRDLNSISAVSASSYCPDSEEKAFLTLINSHRKSNGLGSLKISRTLGGAAEHHSLDMGTTGTLSHTLSDGTTWLKNIANHGYPMTNTSRGEIILWGFSGTAQSAFNWWKSSATHNAVMLKSHYTAIGIGRVYVPGSRYSWYWTVTFGSAFDNAPTC